MTAVRWGTFVTCSTLALLSATTGLRAEDRAKAEKVVKEFLDQKKANAAPAPIEDESLAKAFPDHAFFAVIFRQYPVAVLAPEPFKSQNVLIVPKGSELIHLTDARGLETFFKDHLKPVKDDETARQAVQAWLALTQTFKQDGFFKFSIAKDDFKVAADKGERKATGKFVVAQGGKGELTATLVFDDKGRLTKVTEEDTIKPGVRPICQATKLLDADPLVRRMAEQDLLVMGRACKDYLNEQRAAATPELRKAIDCVWKRIVEEGW
jgi:hypothetical protein